MSTFVIISTTLSKREKGLSHQYPHSYCSHEGSQTHRNTDVARLGGVPGRDLCTVPVLCLTTTYFGNLFCYIYFFYVYTLSTLSISTLLSRKVILGLKKHRGLSDYNLYLTEI